MMGWEDAPQLFVLALASLLLYLPVAACWSHWRPLLSGESAAAEQRAAELLRETLTEDEHRQLAGLGFLTVSSPGVQGRVYRVPGKQGWVEVHEGGRVSMRLCVQPIQPLPSSDVVLMHKLMIEGNEEEYLRKANVVRIPWGIAAWGRNPMSEQRAASSEQETSTHSSLRVSSAIPARPDTP